MTASASAFPAFTPRKATRKAVRLRIAINGPSGSGKTLGGLALAFSLVGDAGKVCVIDTEHNSAELYADKFPAYDVIPLEPPYTSLRYEQALAAAAQYDVVIIDQISHEWDGEGGILDRKAELDKRPGSNSYTNWQSFTPEHRRFLESILSSPAHIVCTMRAKQDYVLQQNDKGKAQPIKVGLAPVQRDGTEYEFSLVFDVQMDHKASASKDRTGLFDGKLVDLCSPKVGESLRGWLSTAEPMAVATMADPAAAIIGECGDCGAPITSALLAERSQHAFGFLVCLACGTKRKEQAGTAAPLHTPPAARPAEVAVPQLRGTPNSAPAPSRSTAAGVAPSIQAPAAVAVSTRETIECVIDSAAPVTKGKAHLFLHLAPLDGRTSYEASCWEKLLWPKLQEGVGQMAVLEVVRKEKDGRKFINIVDIARIGDAVFKDPQLEITDKDTEGVPF